MFARRSRTVLRAAPAALALVLGTAVLASALQAGRPYFYCRAMQAVRSHACCGIGRAQRAGASHDAVVAAPCCEGRSMAALEAGLLTARIDARSAAPVALPASTAMHPPLAVRWSGPADIDPPLRARPPNIRVHALVMVFHV